MGSWYQDMEAFASPAPLSKPRVTLTGSHRERFTDPGIESIEWNLKIYRTIDCATHPGC
jgi:hypothetical protein